MLTVAVVAAAVGGGVGGYVGNRTAAPANSAISTLDQPTPPASDAPSDPISTVAQRVLPSVVQLSGSVGGGSGVVLSSDGLILTNAHVLSTARNGQLTATFHDGTIAPVREVGRDTRADIAVVRAEDVSGLTPIQLGNSDSLHVGQQVIAVGSPLGLAGTVTSGIVSALNRPVQTEPQPTRQRDSGGLLRSAWQPSVLDAIQTDAAINPGNSGGPLVDMQGRIVGINSAIVSLGSGGEGGGSIGLGFAIPINQAKRIADELVTNGVATQAQLGVTVRDFAPTGAQVVEVQPGSSAERAGLRPGDVITKFGDRLVQGADSLVAAVNSAIPGSEVTLTVAEPNGLGNRTDTRTVPVTLGTVTVE